MTMQVDSRYLQGAYPGLACLGLMNETTGQLNCLNGSNFTQNGTTLFYSAPTLNLGNYAILFAPTCQNSTNDFPTPLDFCRYRPIGNYCVDYGTKYYQCTASTGITKVGTIIDCPTNTTCSCCTTTSCLSLCSPFP